MILVSRLPLRLFLNLMSLALTLLRALEIAALTLLKVSGSVGYLWESWKWMMRDEMRIIFSMMNVTLLKIATRVVSWTQLAVLRSWQIRDSEPGGKYLLKGHRKYWWWYFYRYTRWISDVILLLSRLNWIFFMNVIPPLLSHVELDSFARELYFWSKYFSEKWRCHKRKIKQ